jgi:NAD(P)-dependent dehydrogenase (short-subunit alcohol dehydrogenase family)
VLVARTSYDLANRTVLITGAAGGIGSETARQLTAAGANVALLDIEPAGLERLAEELGDRAWWQRADVKSMADMEAAVEGAVARFGGIDVVVANAAAHRLERIEAIDPGEFERVVEVTFLGVWRTVRAALPHVLAAHGYILHVLSVGGVIHSPFNAPYAASKAAVQAFANTLRLEVEDRGVAVGVIYFGLIDTETGIAGVKHPLMAPIMESMPRRLVRHRPVAEAARAIVLGIERRSRVLVYPRIYAPPVRVADFFQRLGERQLRRAIRRAWKA